MQRSTSENMNVQVKYSLTTVTARVDDSAIAIAESQLSGNDGHHLQQVSTKFSVVGSQFCKRCYRLFGNQQNMHRCLGTDVVKGHAMLVFVHDASGDFAVDDLLKDGHRRKLLGETGIPGLQTVEISRNSGKLQQDLRGDPGICRIGGVEVTENRDNRRCVPLEGLDRN